MAMVMVSEFNSIIGRVSIDYARQYATSSADVLSARIARGIDLMDMAAHSDAIIDWLADEGNDAKKKVAYEKMSGIIGELYSNNLYIGVKKSLREYKVNADPHVNNFQPFVTLDENNPDDNWYFACIASDKDYLLNIGNDSVLQKKQVWLNYKVTQNGVPLGVICTGLEFSHVAGELFAQYDNKALRGLIIDENGIINMDSSMLGDEDFLSSRPEVRFNEKFSDPVLLDAVESHLNSIEGRLETKSKPVAVELSAGPYRYATIAPIKSTNWAAVIFYDPSSSFSMSLFLPITAILLVTFIVFALAANAASYRFIFMPLEKLVRSLALLKENNDERIYGIERNDEIGNLSNTILDLFTKANYDALTGINNRRFLENNLRNVMDLLARSDGLLSVLMVDVDFFKKYNDTYGHEQGDVCLKAVAKAMAESIMRTNDFVARYGGEEFVAVLPNTNEDGARLIAEKLLENVRQLNIPHANSAAAQYVTISVGITTGKVAYSQSWEDYLKRADEALYMSKQNGRNKFTYLGFGKIE